MRRTRHRLHTGNEGWLTSYADLMTNLLIFFALIVTASEIQAGRMDQIVNRLSGKNTEGSLTEARRVVEQTVREQNLANQVTVQMTNAGLEISVNSGLAFESGEAHIKPEMLTPLARVLTPLVPLAGKYRFAVEGHSDDRPVGPAAHFRSNWELSSARALEVRDHLESIGVPKDRIRVEAYADTRPLTVEQLRELGLANPSADEIRARSRRVVIRLF